MVKVQGCLNGARLPESHAALPVTPNEIAADAAAAVAAGASSVHVHPKTETGRDTLDPDAVGAVVSAIREAVDVPIGVTTGAWASTSPQQRLGHVAAWNVTPDFASVNWHEEGSVAVAKLLVARGVGVEAGVWSAQAARLLMESGLLQECVRVLVEVTEPEPGAALQVAASMLGTLDRVHDVVLLHGEDAAAWPLVIEAVRLGHDTRIGLEDTLTMPGGSPAANNRELVAAAVQLAKAR